MLVNRISAQDQIFLPLQVGVPFRKILDAFYNALIPCFILYHAKHQRKK